jgi:hypothetical protein
MPSEAEHRNKATRNEAFSGSLDLNDNTRAEWATVALFYAAVHLVEAHLDRSLGYHSPNHIDRKKAMAKIPGLRPCFGEYAHLEMLSENCRYGVRPFTKREYDGNARPCFDRFLRLLPN